MRQIKGDLAAIEQQLNDLPEYDPQNPVWLDIEVSSNEYVTEFQSKIEDLCESQPVEVLLLRREKANRHSQQTDSAQQATLKELNPLEVFQKRLDEEPPQEQQQHLARTKRIAQLFAQVAHDSEQQLQPIQNATLEE